MSINVKPAKIISGMEPERTRYLLQLFTVVAKARCLVPTEKRSDSLSMKQEAIKSEPQMEETEEPGTVVPVENNKGENASPTIVEGSGNSCSSVHVQNEVLEDIRIQSTLVCTNERPATSHGDRQPTATTENDKPVNLMRPATAMSKGSQSISGLEETKASANDLRILQKLKEKEMEE